MSETKHHASELIPLRLDAGARQAMDRRAFIGGLAAAGAAAAWQPSTALAAKGEVVVANWGGVAATGFQKAWGPSFEAATGLKVVIDGSGPAPGKIRSMVEAKNVVWDVCDTSVGAVMQLGEAGLLEEIDYTIVDKSRLRPAFAYKWGVSNYMFSYVMVVNKKRFGNNPPRNWKDFWNVKDFPGKRMLRGSCGGQLEAALIADGVDPKKIYPIDVKRALEKIREIKEHTIFWKTGAQSEDLVRQEEVVAGNMWSNRANLLRIEMKDAIAWPWEGAVVAPAVWLVPKGNPAGKEAAMKFINHALEPDGQIELFKLIGMSPSNPAAAAKIPPELKPYDATQPDHMALQVVLDDDWYGKNMAQVEAQYLEIISS
jgi:putative spermidine/putrescine transport system substrate-binding protein